MYTNYDRQQQARERARNAARTELDTHLLTGTVPATTNWDAELRRLGLTRPAGPSKD